MSADSFDHLAGDPTIRGEAPAPEVSPAPAANFDEVDFEQTISHTRAGSRLFGRYSLQRELGRGGMGIVWLARDEMLETNVALKFLPDFVARDAEALAELKRETLRSRDLRHPGIVGVYEFMQDAQAAAIVMEYIDGPTLSEMKVDVAGSCFDVAQIEPWIRQLCAVLTYAHGDARIVHRDLKPRNLMLTSAGQLKVADFGIARSVSDSLSRLSQRVMALGTPPYMSPQQDTGDIPSISDDIYALGATIYDLLTGKPPFYSGNISKQIHEKIAPSIAERRAALGVEGKAPIPEAWERLVAACLAKTPAERPANAAECLRLLDGAVAAPAPIAAPQPPRRPVLAWAAGIAAVAGVGGFILWNTTHHKETPAPPQSSAAAVAPVATPTPIVPASIAAPPVAVTEPKATPAAPAATPALSKREVIESLLPSVEAFGDLAHGRQIFATTCAACHRADTSLAPTLANPGPRNAREWLTSIVDPNAKVDPAYMQWTIETNGGETYTGIITAEDASHVTFVNLNGVQQVATADIKSKINKGRSLMPEGYESLGGEALRDLVTFLRSTDPENPARVIPVVSTAPAPPATPPPAEATPAPHPPVGGGGNTASRSKTREAPAKPTHPKTTTGSTRSGGGGDSKYRDIANDLLNR